MATSSPVHVTVVRREPMHAEREPRSLGKLGACARDPPADLGVSHDVGDTWVLAEAQIGEVWVLVERFPIAGEQVG